MQKMYTEGNGVIAPMKKESIFVIEVIVIETAASS